MQQAASSEAPTLVVVGRIKEKPGAWVRGVVEMTRGVVTAVYAGLPAGRAIGVNTIDVGDSFVLPGAVDAHVHCLSHSHEGIAAATRSAAAGGVTTIVEMPFDGAGPINSRDRLAAKQDLAAREAFIDIALLGTLAPDGGWREAEKLVAAGAVGFKISLFLTDPARFPRISDFDLQPTMAAVSETGATLCVHAENNEIIKGLLDQAAPLESEDPLIHPRTRPPLSESLAVLTALETAAQTGVKLHLCHLSLPRSTDLAAWYRSQGVDVTVETCPHYLTFTEEDMNRLRGRLKINPPLRSAADRKGLLSRLANGSIDIVASDHAPWPAELKDRPIILSNSSGAPGTETLVALTLGRALARDRTHRSFESAVDALTITPARRFGLSSRKGSLEVGKDADVMVFAPTDDAVIHAAALHSNAGWTPYEGITPGGRVTHTISRGRLVWSSAAGLHGSPGQGEVVGAEG
ncbi:MAG: dihydroorotase family protein [Bifidobacteriaceae bacterium]|nr:dihydroorotase family protein [Bifidobacteriaceae bacterium]